MTHCWVDLHVHLLAGLDDGPADPAEALQLSQTLVQHGVTHAVALAHQNRRYRNNTPDKLRQATENLQQQLLEQSVPLEVFPTAEVEVRPDLPERWQQGKILSIADRQQFVLLEFPHDQWLDLQPLFVQLRSLKLRPVIAHAERTPELFEPGLVEKWIREGCLIQVSTSAIMQPPNAKIASGLKDWAKRGIIHALGTDGHRPSHRPPIFAPAIDILKHWTSASQAEEMAGKYAYAILKGLPVLPPIPEPLRRSWFSAVQSFFR